MIASSTSTLGNLRFQLAVFHRIPKSPKASYEPDSERQPRKFKPSPQLNRWSRARSLRSGRKFDRTGQHSQQLDPNPPLQLKEQVSPEQKDTTLTASNGGADVDLTAGKSIYMVSDGTGWTVEHSVGAALGQFEHCLVDRNCAVNTHLFSGVSSASNFIALWFNSKSPNYKP